MCGICGILNLENGPPPERDLLTRMMGRLRHRGPDSSGIYRDRRAALGHTRLEIIDLETGAQPLANEDGSIWIAFNGEIFNYVELSARLRDRGHVFSTQSDTEIIVHAYEEYGTACFERFNGQWALALWDRAGRRLILSRDRHGIRPLYYVIHRNRLLFASEIKSLFAEKGIERRLDPAGLSEILTFWSPVAPRTVFHGIRELEPGHFAVVENGRMARAPYWRLDFPEKDAGPFPDEKESASRLRDRLIAASRLRFTRSDVPVGAYLSGGIDSSIISSIVSRYTEAPLDTFSIRFTDPEFDEGRYQAEMVRRLGSVHHEVRVSREDIGEAFPSVVRHAERPLLRTAPAPLFLLSRRVREAGYKVVVTGEGADEVLAGYDIFREASARRFLARDPESKKRARILLRLYPWMKRSPGRVPAFARAFFGQDLDPSDPFFSHRPRWNAASVLQHLLHPELRGEVEKTDVVGDLAARMPTDCGGWDPLCRAQWLEMVSLLSGYILSAQGDRMLMAHSVEGRFPFLDCGLVALANRLPPWHKLLALDEKHLLKVAFRDLIPPSILERSKQPYRAPDAACFFHETSPDWVDALTDETTVRKARIFSPAAVSRLTEKCRRVGGLEMSHTDNMRIMAVLSGMLVYHYFIERDGGDGGGLPQPVRMIDRVTSG